MVTPGSLLSDPLGVNATRQRRTWRSAIDFTDGLDPRSSPRPLACTSRGSRRPCGTASSCSSTATPPRRWVPVGGLWPAAGGRWRVLTDPCAIILPSGQLTTGQNVLAGVCGGTLACWNHPFEVARIEAQARADQGQPAKSMAGASGRPCLRSPSTRDAGWCPTPSSQTGVASVHPQLN